MIDDELKAILVCPACKKALALKENPPSLKCAECRRVYPIQDGIPILLIDRFVTYTEAEEQTVHARGEKIDLFPEFHLDLDLGQIVPPKFGWQALLKLDGDELEAHYRHCLEELGKQPGMLGEIFKKARAEIQNPERLRRLIVDLIEPVKWSSMQADVKGDIYEGLLAKSAEESPKGAGQYFTPRPLIKGIVDCVQPTAADTVPGLASNAPASRAVDVSRIRPLPRPASPVIMERM